MKGIENFVLFLETFFKSKIGSKERCYSFGWYLPFALTGEGGKYRHKKMKSG